MLWTLQIRNFALVENLRVEFQSGLNMITGETGAGKSILMGALSLLLGERADKSVVRTGETQAAVEAVFNLARPQAVNAILAASGIEPCQDGQLVLRRVVSTTGAGGNFINGSPATLPILKQVGNQLVDMHGPHDHQSLLSQDSQMDILDAFGGLSGLRGRYEEAYAGLCGLQAERRALDCDEKTVAEQIDLLSFQVKELTEAAPVEGEEEEVKAKHDRIANAHLILEAAQKICHILTDGESSTLDSIAGVQREIEIIEKVLPEAAEWRKEAQSASVQLRELSRTVSGLAGQIEGDPGQLQWLDDRLALYQKMKRKYGMTVAEMLAHLEKAKKRLHELETRGERIADMDARIAGAVEAVKSLGKKLGKERRAAAGELSKSVTRELQDLGFAKGAFKVELKEVEPRNSGTDEIEFGFAPNVGEAMRPLRAIASSGEISRVMLATKAVLAKHDRIPVLVFDEIDANVGGEMGSAIGRKLAGIAGTHQVICITHLPQVAVHGAAHFAVEKHVRGERTFTEIKRLEGNGRIDELARMLGGVTLTKLTREHAREMLAAAQKKREE